MRRTIFGLIAGFLILARGTFAITISSGPTFIPATNAPLAGVLQLTTDVDSRVSIHVTDGTNTWTRDFYDFSTTHAETLLGFKPGRTNQIAVTCYDQYRNVSATQPVNFVTAPLPADFPTSVVLTNQPGRMEPGYTLFILQHNNTQTGAYIVIMDQNGQVVWYRPWTANDFDVRQLGDGTLFMEQTSPSNNFVAMNMQGNIIRTWNPPAAYPVENHEGLATAHGTILYLSHASQFVTNFPSSTANNAPRITARVDDDPVVEISASNSTLIQAWSPLSFIDPTRITWLTYQFSTPYGVDNEHANAVIEDTNDDSLLVSLRDQNAVCKFSRLTGKLIWVLGPHEGWGASWQTNLLTPVGTPFNWNYGQHAPEFTPQHTLLVYNDNNAMSTPPTPALAELANQSSAIEYAINETNLEVSEIWNSSRQTNQDRLFTGVLGKAQWLPETGNILVTYGAVSAINGVRPSSAAAGATMVRLIEYTHDPVPQVVFDLSFFDYTNSSSSYKGYSCYRSYRIHDLYPHPAAPVADIVIGLQDSLRTVKFSADPTHDYLIQTSTDLVHWSTIGPATPEPGTGNFDFTDPDASSAISRFYRVGTN